MLTAAEILQLLESMIWLLAGVGIGEGVIAIIQSSSQATSLALPRGIAALP